MLSVPLNEPAEVAVTVANPSSLPMLSWADTVNILLGGKLKPWKLTGLPAVTVEGTEEKAGDMGKHTPCVNGVVFSTFEPACTTTFNEPEGKPVK